MPGLAGTPAEAVPIVRRGMVARIQQSGDFFIALDDHEEWGHSFTVFGDMRDDVAGMETLERIAGLPFREQKAAGAETIMRLLNVEIQAHGALIRSHNHTSISVAEAALPEDLAGGAPTPQPHVEL